MIQRVTTWLKRINIFLRQQQRGATKICFDFVSRAVQLGILIKCRLEINV